MNTKNKNKKEKLVLLAGVFALFMLTASSEIVSASAGSVVRNAGNRIGGFFNTYANSSGPGVLDFLIFSVIFISLCYAGFSSIFKEAKNASIMLAISVGFALSVGLVYGGKFTLKKILPFSAAILFILLFVAIYALLKKFVFSSDTIGSKILSAVIAIIISVALIVASIHFICADDNCETSPFLRKIFGSESIFGRLSESLSSAGDRLSNATESSETTTEETESTDTNTEEDNAEDNQEPSGWDTAWSYAKIPLILALIGLAIFGSIKGKEKYKQWRKNKNYRSVRPLIDHLLDNEFEKDSESIHKYFSELINQVKNEKIAVINNRAISTKLNKDIKETIGEEIDYLKKEEHTEFNDNIKKITEANYAEQKISAGIINLLKKQVDCLDSFNEDTREEVVKGINEMTEIDKHFKKHKELLDSLSDFNLKEKGVIDNLRSQINSTYTEFTLVQKRCNEIITTLETMKKECIDKIIAAETSGTLKYQDILNRIHALRDGTIKLNGLFMQKLANLRNLSQALSVEKERIIAMHEEEIDQIEYIFLRNAQACLTDELSRTPAYDTAIYFALHVLNNAEYILHKEHDQTHKEKINNMISQARDVIKQALPKVFESMIPRIEDEIRMGNFDNIITALEKLETMITFNEEDRVVFAMELGDFDHKTTKLKWLCEKLKKGETVAKRYFNDLGFK